LLRLLPSTLLLGRSIRRAPHRLLQLYVLLGTRHNVFQVGDIMLHQVFVEGMVGLQSSSECSCDNIIITVTDQRYLTLKITDIALEGFSVLHLDCKKMIAVLFELLS